MNRDHLMAIVREIHQTRYSDAKVIFLAGSLVRGTGTRYSDLDLVVLFEQLPNAFRESFYSGGYPVEAFVHDPETLHFFLTEFDRPTGMASLAQMIGEGIEVPGPSEFSEKIKALAASVRESGPPRLTADQIDDMRYQITGLIDDIRDPCSHAELVAAGTELYNELANFWLRTHCHWGAKGKSIPWQLADRNAAFADKYNLAFEDLFVNKDPTEVIFLAEQELGSFGGLYFDGHRRDAPQTSRKTVDL